MATTALRKPEHIFPLGMHVFYRPAPDKAPAAGTINGHAYIDAAKGDGEPTAGYHILPAGADEEITLPASAILHNTGTPDDLTAAGDTEGWPVPLPVTIHWHESNHFRMSTDLDVADFLDYAREAIIGDDIDATIFCDLFTAADAEELDEEALRLAFRSRITDALNDERRSALTDLLKAYFVEAAWPDYSAAKHINGDSDIDEVYLPSGRIVTVDRSQTPGAVRLRASSVSDGASVPVERVLDEDLALRGSFIDGRYDTTTVHLLPEYIRVQAEEMLAEPEPAPTGRNWFG